MSCFCSFAHVFEYQSCWMVSKCSLPFYKLALGWLPCIGKTRHQSISRFLLMLCLNCRFLFSWRFVWYSCCVTYFGNVSWVFVSSLFKVLEDTKRTEKEECWFQWRVSLRLYLNFTAKYRPQGSTVGYVPVLFQAMLFLYMYFSIALSRALLSFLFPVCAEELIVVFP